MTDNPVNGLRSLFELEQELAAARETIDKLARDCASAWRMYGELARRAGMAQSSGQPQPSAGSLEREAPPRETFIRAPSYSTHASLQMKSNAAFTLVASSEMEETWLSSVDRLSFYSGLSLNVEIVSQLSTLNIDQAIRRSASPQVIIAAVSGSANDGLLNGFQSVFDEFPLLLGASAIVRDLNGRIVAAGAALDDHGAMVNSAAGLSIEDYRILSATRRDVLQPTLFSIVRDIYEDLGGFDLRAPSLQAALYDLSVRAYDSGYEIRQAPSAQLEVSIDFRGLSSGADVASFNTSASALARSVAAHRRPAVLFLDAVTPTRDKDAGSMDTFWCMRIFLSLGYDVTFAPMYDTTHAGKYTDELRRLGVECALGSDFASTPEFIEREGSRFQAIMIYRVVVAYVLLDVCRRFAPAAKVIFHTVDLHYIREEREAELQNSDELRAQAQGTKGEELRCIAQSDAAIVVSQAEYELLGQITPGAARYLVPIMNPGPGRLGPLEGREGVLFVGGFGHSPNADAVKFLCTEIWPLVRRQKPNAQLMIVGADPPPDVLRHHDASVGIEVVGYVPSLAAFYRFSRVNVAPLRFGAGIKGKVLSAMMVGLPTVATDIAAEGMNLTGDIHAIIANSPAEFAHSIVRLLEDSQLWRNISDAGLEFAQDKFTVDAQIPRMRQILRDLALPC